MCIIRSIHQYRPFRMVEMEHLYLPVHPLFEEYITCGMMKDLQERGGGRTLKVALQTYIRTFIPIRMLLIMLQLTEI